jgi:hypothetical protein
VPDIPHSQVGVVDMMMMILYQQICAVHVAVDLLVVTLVVMMVLLMTVALMMVVAEYVKILTLALQMPMVMAVPDIPHSQVGVVDTMMMILYQQICAVHVAVDQLVHSHRVMMIY